jgi:hypothetical protein
MYDLLKMKKNNIRNQLQRSHDHIKEKVALGIVHVGFVFLLVRYFCLYFVTNLCYDLNDNRY